MKKIVSLMLSAVLIFSLAACGTQGSQNSSSNENEVTESPSDSSESGTDASEEMSAEAAAEETITSEPSEDSEDSDVSETAAEPEEPAEGTGGILVAYFSWSGNTEQVAQIIAEQTGGDLFKIETATPYTDDYNTLLDIARQEQEDDARPELAAQVDDWDSYDVIFVGYPNWWSDAPMAVYTFLESYDWNGKTLIPFNTSSSGGFGRSLSGIEESAAGATVLEGLDLTESELSDAQSRVTEWLNQ